VKEQVAGRASMDALNALLKQKKDALADKKRKAAGGAHTEAGARGGRKYLKNSERQQLEADAHAQAPSGGAAGPDGGTAASDEPADPHQAHRNSLEAEEPLLPAPEVKGKLRGWGEPVTLFGESDRERFTRMKKMAAIHAERELQKEEEDVFKHKQRGDNFLQDVKHMQQAEEERLAKLREAQADAISGKQAAAKGKEEPAEGDAALTDDQYFAQRVAEAAKIAQRMQEEEGMDEEDRIVLYLERLLKAWAEELAEDETIVRSAEGKQLVATFKQTDRYLEPMLEQLRNRTINPDILRGLKLIVGFMRQREYLSAMDAYVKVTIGNAAWPIGVTSVGIHERGGREKISDTNKEWKAHIMSDETSRKYLVSLKRLITFAQRKFPTDPSKCIEFNSLANGSDLKALTGKSIDDKVKDLSDIVDVRDHSVRLAAAMENNRVQ